MSARVIQDGGQVIKDSNDTKTYCVDWRDMFGASVQINTSTWTITAISPSTTDAVLTKDNEAILTAAQATTALEETVDEENLVTRVRLAAGTNGQKYQVANKVVTNESPTQTIERSFFVLVEDR
jgi:hypothetical protein